MLLFRHTTFRVVRFVPDKMFGNHAQTCQHTVCVCVLSRGHNLCQATQCEFPIDDNINNVEHTTMLQGKPAVCVGTGNIEDHNSKVQVKVSRHGFQWEILDDVDDTSAYRDVGNGTGTNRIVAHNGRRISALSPNC